MGGGHCIIKNWQYFNVTLIHCREKKIPVKILLGVKDYSRLQKDQKTTGFKGGGYLLSVRVFMIRLIQTSLRRIKSLLLV